MRFVFTTASSMKTTRPGKAAMAGARRARQSELYCLTLARSRLVSAEDFLACEPEAGQQIGDGGMMGLHAFCIGQGIPQFKECHIRAFITSSSKKARHGASLPVL